MPEHCSYRGCTRPRYKGQDKCIFHCETKDPQEFRNALAAQIREWRDPKKRATVWDFSGWVFVDVDRRPDSEHWWEKYNLFRRAVFPTHIEFGGVRFQTPACFISARFTGDAYFSSAQFTKNADFSYASFAVLADLTNVTIAGEVRLIWPGVGFPQTREGKELKAGRMLLESLRFEKSAEGKAPLLDLRNNVLREDSRLIIRHTNLSRVLFTATDCRQIEFYNCTWREMDRRRVVADEWYLRHDRSALSEHLPPWEQAHAVPAWSEIATTYQQLVKRFRDDLEHQIANDFERGLFEARRMDAKAQRHWGQYVLYGLYKWVSNYSGSLIRPVLWLLAVTLLATFCYDLFLYGGTRIITIRAVTESVLTGFLGCGLVALAYGALAGLWIELRWLWRVALFAFMAFLFGPACYHLLHHALSFLSAGSYEMAMKALSLDRTVLAEALRAVHGSANSPLLTVATLQLILSATLITLFIFSVRRRFKHSE